MISGPQATPLKLVSKRGHTTENLTLKTRVLTEEAQLKLAALNRVARVLREKGVVITSQSLYGNFPAMGEPSIRILRGRLAAKDLLAFGRMTYAFGPGMLKTHYLQTYDGVFITWIEAERSRETP